MAETHDQPAAPIAAGFDRSPNFAGGIQALQILDSSDDCIKVLDLEGRILFVNRGGQTLLGIQDITPFLNTSWVNFWQESEQPAARDAIARAGAGEVCSLQGYCPTLNGEPKWWDNKISPILGADGKVERLVCISRDITDRKRAEDERQQTEAALRASEEQFRLFITASSGSVYKMSADWREMRLLDGKSFLAGTQHPNQTWLEQYIPPEEQARVRAAIAEAIRTKSIFELEHRVVQLDGTIGWTFSRAIPLLDDQNKIVEWLGAASDITVAKHLEASRKQVEHERDRFLAVGSDLQVITGDDGYFRWVSPTFERLLGWTTAEITSRPWIEFVHPEDVSTSQQEAASLFSGNETFAFENRYRHKDGSYRWLRWNAKPYPAEQTIYGTAVDITKRKQTEIALRESEERFRSLTTTIPQLIWTTTPDGSVDYLSHQWADYIGLPPEQLYDWQWQDVVHPEDLPNTLRDWGHCLQTGEPIEVKHRFRFHTGEWRWQLVRGTPVRDPAGQITKWVGTCTDIQSEMDAQAALHQSEARLRTVAANLPNGAAFIIDRALRYQLAEGKALEEAGFTAQDFVGKTIWESLDPDLAAIYEPYFRQALNGEPFSWEHHSHDRDYISHGAPLANAAGQIEAVLVVSYDITDRKRAEAALEESEEFNRSIVESSADCIKVLDLDGRLLTLNKPGQCLLEVENCTPLIGTVWVEFWQEPERTYALAAIHTALTEGIGRFSGYCPTAKGTPKWWDVVVTPILDITGKPKELLVVSRDITDHRRAEAERERLLQREQTAREAAERANRIKDEFLAVLSHELRTPLNPILGWTRLLSSGKLNATKTAQAIETIERNAKLQVQLIEDLLDISRILRGKLSLNVMPVQLDQVILAALDTVRLAAEAKSLQIQTTLPPQITVNGDSGRLQQVVWNLLSNAVKFTPPGGRVEVKLEQPDEGGRQKDELSREIEPSSLILHSSSFAQIIVTDTGKGIHPDFLPYVFEHFRQEDGTTTRQFGGLGLGLAIVRQMVELHGGTVEATSAGEGQGATFTVRLPLLKATVTPVNAPVSIPLPANQPLSQVRVLVIDDEADTRDLTTFVLEQAGAIVRSVPSAFAALNAVDQFKPNVLVSDIGMPEMDGYALLNQFRQSKQNSAIPAIALTAYVGETDQQQAIAAGFQHHLAKPVEPAQLVAIVKHYAENPMLRQP